MFEADLEQLSFLTERKAAFNAPLWKHSALHRRSILTHNDILVFEAPRTYEARMKGTIGRSTDFPKPFGRRTDLLAPGFLSSKRTADLHQQSNEHRSA